MLPGIFPATPINGKFIETRAKSYPPYSPQNKQTVNLSKHEQNLTRRIPRKSMRQQEELHRHYYGAVRYRRVISAHFQPAMPFGIPQSVVLIALSLLHLASANVLITIPFSNTS